MNDLGQLIGIGTVAFSILGALVLGYALGYNARDRKWR